MKNKNGESAETQNKEGKRVTFGGVLNVIGIVLCVLLVPILIINCLLIVKGMLRPSEVPSVGKYCPLIVLTESMEPEICPGDLIICKRLSDESELSVGTTVSFFDPAGNGSSVVTHKIIAVITDGETGETLYKTKGVNNNIEDRTPFPIENVIGVYTGVRFPFVGRAVMFVQSPMGLITCIVVPVALIAAAWYINKRREDKKKQAELNALKAQADSSEAQERIEELTAQLEALKAAAAQNEDSEHKTDAAPAASDENDVIQG